MPGFISIFEMRRTNPLHYEVKAYNARLSAFLLWNASRSPEIILYDRQIIVDRLSYDGVPAVAWHEAFEREAAIALELMIKAVIVQRVEYGISNVGKVPPTHNLPKLWEDASLPALGPDGKRVLLIAKTILYWSGRYPAPKKDEEGRKESEELNCFKGARSSDKSGLLQRGIFEWEHVNKVYQVAAHSFWTIRQGQDAPADFDINSPPHSN